MSERIVLIVQARMASGRLPGKVLMPLLDQPMLLWQLERLTHTRLTHHLVVATSADAANDPIAALCTRHGYECARPPGIAEQDVLGRFHAVADAYSATQVVRVCGDCPLIDPVIIDALLVRHAHTDQPDHTSIAAEWPDGMDAEVIRREALDRAHVEATHMHDREHVTSHIWSQPGSFRLATLPCPFNLVGLQVSVDTRHDLAMTGKLLEWLLNEHGHAFTWLDVWHMVERHAILRDWQRARPPRNSSFLRQLGVEQSWEMVRYGTNTSTAGQGWDNVRVYRASAR